MGHFYQERQCSVLISKEAQKTRCEQSEERKRMEGESIAELGDRCTDRNTTEEQ